MKYLSLKDNIKITNEGLLYIKDIKKLNLNSNVNITDEGLKYLTNIHTL